MLLETFKFTDPEGNTLSVVTDDIAWYIDRKTYKNYDLSKQWLNMEDGKVFKRKNNEKNIKRDL